MALRTLSGPLLALPRGLKQAMVIVADMALCALTVWLAYYLRLGKWVSLSGRPLLGVALSILIAIPLFWATGIYTRVFRHLDAGAVTVIAITCALYGICYATLISFYGFADVPRTVGFIQPVLLFLAICSLRVTISLALTPRVRQVAHGEIGMRALVYGAGSSGQQLVRAMAASRGVQVVGFLDDDVSLRDSRVSGIKVYNPDRIRDLVEDLEVSDILLALPSVSRRRRNAIISQLQGLSVGIRTLPGLMDLAHGHVEATDLRELTIEDLLRREPIEGGDVAAHDTIRDRIVLVTGAGGSIGSELCRQIMVARPAKLLLFEANEYALYAIHRQLSGMAEASSVELVALLGSVTDARRTEEVVATWRPDMLFHAAAYKHVPLVEHNLLEGLRNNVLGTEMMARLAVRYGVGHFVLVSTDKAVRPTNVMGASKRLAELILQALASEQDGTCFSMVRFGNVLGSSGSVVPLFREQIHAGGPITITHADITRYFMTIPEAAQLVIRAGMMARGGEVFVLNMGEPVRIYDLAVNMIELSGLTLRTPATPDGDIEILTIGLRPGEKLYEELLIGDNPQPTAHSRIMMASEDHLPWSTLEPKLELLAETIADGDAVRGRSLLCELVPEFTPTSEVVDWVYAAHAHAGRGDDAEHPDKVIT